MSPPQIPYIHDQFQPFTEHALPIPTPQVSFVILVVKSPDLKSHHLQEPSLPPFPHSTSSHVSACISVSYVPFFSESVLKVVTLKDMLSLVVMYGCESWTIKTECWRVDAFELWCWRGLLSVLWTVKSNQPILKEINPEYSLEGLVLKLKLQYLCYLMWRVNSLEKTLMLGKSEGRRRRGQQRMRWLAGITNSVDMSLSKLQDSGGQRSVACCSPWGHKESDTTLWGNNNLPFPDGHSLEFRNTVIFHTGNFSKSKIQSSIDKRVYNSFNSI